MELIPKEELEKLVEEAKAAGKDTSKLEKTLERLKVAREVPEPPMGKTKETETDEGTVVIESTGPVKEEDFE